MKIKVFPQEESLGYWVYRVQTQSVASLRRTFQAAGFDITPEQWTILARLREEQGISQSRLGEKTLKDRHNITRIINLLEKKGAVERKPDPTDKRIYKLFLTERGQNIQDELSAVTLRHARLRFKGIRPEDLARLRGLLGLISDNLERMLHDGPCRRCSSGKKKSDRQKNGPLASRAGCRGEKVRSECR